MSEEWDNGFFKIADVYKREFYKCENVDDYLVTIASSEVRLGVLCEVYKILVRKGKIDPIESISDEEKLKIWDEAKRVTNNHDKKQIHKICKSIYSLAQYIQL